MIPRGETKAFVVCIHLRFRIAQQYHLYLTLSLTCSCRLSNYGVQDILGGWVSSIGSSTLHIPKCLRERICAILSDCLEGTLAGEAIWGILAEAVTKLILYGC